MLTFAALDKAVTLAEQMRHEVGAVALINVFQVPADSFDSFLDWFENAHIPAAPPRFGS